MKGQIFILLLAATLTAKAQAPMQSFREVLALAESKSLRLQNNELLLEQSKKAKLAALLGIADPQGGVSGTYTNNTRLPVSLFPAEILGGQPGTFQKVALGVQYQTVTNTTLEVKLVNPGGWQALKGARLNILTTGLSNKMDEKSWQEDLAQVYYNIVQLQRQQQVARQHLAAADTLLQISSQRYAEGQVRQQDVNDSKANFLNMQESLAQIGFQLSRQYGALKILAGLPENHPLRIEQPLDIPAHASMLQVEQNDLAARLMQARLQASRTEYRRLLFNQLPTLSVQYGYSSTQFNTRARLLDKQADWIPASYIGLRLNINLPTAAAVSQVARARYDYFIARNNSLEAMQQSALRRTELATALEQARSRYHTDSLRLELRRDTYTKNRINYQEGLTGLFQTINSFEALVNAEYDLATAAAAVLLWLEKVKINNENK